MSGKDDVSPARGLFLEAVVLDADAQHELLKRVAAEDAELGEAVRALLDEAAHADRRFRHAAERIGVTAVLRDPEMAPTQLGPYRVCEALGSGGMGTVYLGERCDGAFAQQVAIKVLPAEMGGESWRRRFLQERAILARINHPNITRLYDGGVTPEGQPYFVMELVDGQTIDDYCRDHALDVDARLALFLEVCAGVEWAHRHLVVHRDLKPGNVLVSKEGQVKLVDFGIAKLLDPEAEDSGTTAFGLRPMTPRYASPEALQGEPITTATDVYGLGVLLYELLAERHPYTALGESPSLAHSIQHDDPRLASRVCPESARNRLRGDLDQILAKAMQKDPNYRYGIGARAVDLRRTLGEPVLLGSSLTRLAAVSLKKSDYKRAHTLAGEAVGLLEAADARRLSSDRIGEG